MASFDWQVVFEGLPILMTAKELSSGIRIKDKTIYRLADRGKIPYVRIGSGLFFVKAEIIKWLEGNSWLGQ